MSVLIDIEGYETKGIKIDPNGTEGRNYRAPRVTSLYFQKNRSDRRFSSMKNQRQCRCGNASLCLKSCKGFAVWMSGSKNLPSFGKSFVLTSNKSFSVGVTVCGFTIMGSLRILQGDTICFYNGLKLISDTHHTLLSKGRSFSTWLLAKLIPVVSVSLYTKCRRSGYTNICSAVLVDEASQVKEKLLGHSVKDW